MTDAIFELALLPQAQQDEIRTEVRQALADEGGWNKESLAKFRKLDSLLKEIGRVQGLSRCKFSSYQHLLLVFKPFTFPIVVMIRTTIQDGTLPDGTVIPTGYKVSMDMTQVHMNPEIYPEPEVFDPFRFSKLAEKTGNNAKYGFTAVDKNVCFDSPPPELCSPIRLSCDKFSVFAVRIRKACLVSGVELTSSPLVKSKLISYVDALVQADSLPLCVVQLTKESLWSN